MLPNRQGCQLRTRTTCTLHHELSVTEREPRLILLPATTCAVARRIAGCRGSSRCAVSTATMTIGNALGRRRSRPIRMGARREESAGSVASPWPALPSPRAVRTICFGLRRSSAKCAADCKPRIFAGLGLPFSVLLAKPSDPVSESNERPGELRPPRLNAVCEGSSPASTCYCTGVITYCAILSNVERYVWIFALMNSSLAACNSTLQSS